MLTSLRCGSKSISFLAIAFATPRLVNRANVLRNSCSSCVLRFSTPISSRRFVLSMEIIGVLKFPLWISSAAPVSLRRCLEIASLENVRINIMETKSTIAIRYRLFRLVVFTPSRITSIGTVVRTEISAMEIFWYAPMYFDTTPFSSSASKVIWRLSSLF